MTVKTYTARTRGQIQAWLRKHTTEDVKFRAGMLDISRAYGVWGANIEVDGILTHVKVTFGDTEVDAWDLAVGEDAAEQTEDAETPVIRAIDIKLGRSVPDVDTNRARFYRNENGIVQLFASQADQDADRARGAYAFVSGLSGASSAYDRPGEYRTYAADCSSLGTYATEAEARRAVETYGRDLRIVFNQNDYNTADYCDGDRGDAIHENTTTETYADYDAEFDFDLDEGDAPKTPVQWAIATIRPLASFEPSVSPIPDALNAHAWLGSSERQFTRDGEIDTEISVRLEGNWTPKERAEVFRGVTRRG